MVVAVVWDCFARNIGTITGAKRVMAAICMFVAAVRRRADSPASLSRPHSIAELHTLVGVHAWLAAVQWDVVETPIPDGGVAHAVGRECKDSTDEGTEADVIPYE
jgi:hypothetical protein